MPATPQIIQARWDDQQKAWLIRAPSHGWTQAPGPGESARGYTEAQLAGVVRRMFGHQETKGVPIVVVTSDEVAGQG